MADYVHTPALQPPDTGDGKQGETEQKRESDKHKAMNRPNVLLIHRLSPMNTGIWDVFQLCSLCQPAKTICFRWQIELITTV